MTTGGEIPSTVQFLEDLFEGEMGPQKLEERAKDVDTEWSGQVQRWLEAWRAGSVATSIPIGIGIGSSPGRGVWNGGEVRSKAAVEDALCLTSQVTTKSVQKFE